MSLFGTSFGQAIRKPDAGKGAKTKRLFSIADHHTLSCSQCPLDRALGLQHPKMVPTGSNKPLIYILGEAPGASDDQSGGHFSAQSGELVRDRIPDKFVHKIRWNNTIRCSTGGRDPEPLELACCRRLQVADIEQTQPPVVVGFGGVPLSWTLGPDRSITAYRGRRVPVQIGKHRCWYYPITRPLSVLQSGNDRKKGDAIVRCFERDLERVFSDVERGLPEPDIETDFLKGIECLTEYDDIGLEKIQLALSYWQNDDHAIDIETDRLRPYHRDAKILSIAVGTYDDVLSFPYEHPEAKWTPAERGKIKDMLRHYLLGRGKKWAHGAKFEMEWMHARYGPEILYETEWGDTLGQAHILDERPGKSLDDLTQIHLGFRIKDQSPNIDVKNMLGVPLRDMLPYNGMDTKYCHALSIIQTDLLETAALTHVYNGRHAATASIVQMQARGMVRDSNEINRQINDLTKQAGRLEHQIMSNPDVVRFIRGGGKFKPSSNPNLVTFFRDFLNISPSGKARQGGAWHKSGGTNEQTKYSVDEGALSQIKHPISKPLLELRSLDKNLGTYLLPMADGGKQVHGDGLIHPAFSQYVTGSGRLNSEDPNAQNFPRREHKEVRRIIMAQLGYRFYAFDYGQLEWRIGAILSRDKSMGNEIKAKQDIHGRWTDEIGQAFVPGLVKENRKKVRDSIKQYWTFANLYGNVLEAVARDLSTEFKVDIRPGELQPYFDAFWDQYPLLKEYQEKLLSFYWAKGYVSTGTGQRRHEPMARNEIINHPFQGTAGHLVVDAQRMLAERAYREGRPQLAPFLNVHDDLSFYLPDSTAEQDIEDIAYEMCRLPAYNFDKVPLSVELSCGDNWCDKEEVHTFYTTDFEY